MSDTGIGIPKDDLDGVFSEFTSLDSAYNRRQGGTGLGLAICRNLLQLMGGKIYVESTLGQGSRFSFDLPLVIADKVERPMPEEDNGEAQSETCEPARILLVEDTPTNALVAKAILSKAGHEVSHVTNGEQAVKAAGACKFDIILMDISMPGMDGLEATRLIRKLPTSGAAVPIVAMTAHSLSGDRERFIAAGMNDYVTKPIRKASMLYAIQANLDRSRTFSQA